MTKQTPTEEQENIIAQASAPDNLMLQAYAGCAKSTTLEMLGAKIRVPSLALAFNKRIAEGMRPRFASNFEVKTLNGLGHGAWSRTLLGRKLTLDERKLGKLVTQVAKDRQCKLSGDQWNELRRLVSLAQSTGLVPDNQGFTGLVPDSFEGWGICAEQLWLTPDELEFYIPLAREILVENIRLAREGIISFDDQVYCSTLLGGKFPKFPMLFVDEAQDLSALNHAMLGQCYRERLVAVGDPKQAIYQFRGAHADSFGQISALAPGRPWQRLPLTLTFRCPRSVVERQQAHAQGFRAHERNPLGQVLSWRGFASDESEALWNWSQVEALAEGRKIAVICRNNAPLLKLAFKLLRQCVGVTMLGRDIGKGLESLVKKILPDACANAVACASAIESWREHELGLARANKQEEKEDSINDRAECLRAVLSGALCSDAAGLLLALQGLFAREGSRVELATIHKAKGLEWPLVVFLDPWRVPSSRAKRLAREGNDTLVKQERNLSYVAETRTQDVLVLASLDDFE